MADDLSHQLTQTTSGQFVTNCWYVALWASELPADGLVARTLLGRPVLLFRRQDGTPAAMDDTCSHRFAPLSMGKKLPGDRIQCPYHGLEFNADGRCVHNPHGNGAIPQAAHLRGYTLVERHQMIWIWMGERPADPSKIPDYSCLDAADPLHATDPGYMMMNAHYELVIDNLLDLSHISYLHAGILGSAGTIVADIEVTQNDDIITVARRSTDGETPGMLKMMGAVEQGDQWTVISWMPPSCLLLNFGCGPTGRPMEEGTGYYAIHLLTPETDRTTHYCFSAVRWNVQTTDRALNEEVRGNIAKMRRFAFVEQDGPVIEAQQRRMDAATTPLQPVLLSIDAGPVQYQRILRRMLADDR